MTIIERQSLTRTLEVGAAISQPGQVIQGWFDLGELPTREAERLPVIILQGA